MEAWTSGDAYEEYVGRWSRLLAPRFLTWARVGPGRVLDVGCGTGAVSAALADRGATPSGIDPAAAYVERARRAVPRGRFEVAGAESLPFPDASFDAAVSGLVLNFVPDPARAASEMARVVKPGGTVAAYVWDYAGRMDLMRKFWDAAGELDPAARALDEGARFPLCQPRALQALLRGAGLKNVAAGPLDQPTVFRDFDDYWRPFLGGQGPAPTYCAGLTPESRAKLRERVRAALPIRSDGSIHLIARAWAVRGAKP